MKAAKLSFDFSDHPQLVELLRLQAVQAGTSQKAVLVKALQGYFAHQQENQKLLKLAEAAFSAWDNPDDAVYDRL